MVMKGDAEALVCMVENNNLRPRRMRAFVAYDNGIGVGVMAFVKLCVSGERFCFYPAWNSCDMTLHDS